MSASEQALQAFLEQQSVIRADSPEDRLLVLEELKAVVQRMKAKKLRWQTLKILGESEQADVLYGQMHLTIQAVTAILTEHAWLREVVSLEKALVGDVEVPTTT